MKDPWGQGPLCRFRGPPETPSKGHELILPTPGPLLLGARGPVCPMAPVTLRTHPCLWPPAMACLLSLCSRLF